MTIKNMIFDIIIIGAGIAGITAARAAKAQGHNVLVLDKGRRIGGRCATKRIEGYLFNHGAQFLTASSPSFVDITDAALKAGALQDWDFGHHRPTMIGSPSMRDFASFLATDLAVRQSVKICKIERVDGLYHLTDEEGEAYRSHKLLVTPPAPQSAALLRDISPALARTADTAAYDPCWTAMIALDDALQSTALPLRDKPPIGWAAYEGQKTGAEMPPALTIQADPQTSKQMIDEGADEVCAHLISAFEAATAQKLAVRFAAAHRWLYARVATSAAADAPFADHDNHLAIAGDWFGKARLESAYLSGKRAAAALGF